MFIKSYEINALIGDELQTGSQQVLIPRNAIDCLMLKYKLNILNYVSNIFIVLYVNKTMSPPRALNSEKILCLAC